MGSRQEQRFHFELGLLKLVHLRRLLPIEEVLSQFPVAGRPAIPAAKAPSSGVMKTVAASVAPVSSKPAFSPFEADKGRKRFDESAVVAAPIAATHIAPVVVKAPTAVVVAEEVAPKVEVVAPEVKTADVQPAQAHTAEWLQTAAIEALRKVAGQDTAAEALEDSVWTIEGAELRVQTEISKVMLPMVVNPEAEKVVKDALREVEAGGLKLVLLAGVATAAVKKPRAVKSGSAQAKAMEHPVVQQAQRLFNAEIRNVIDLREGE
jgi:DNA polymerase-3 subunit gamma/tau